MFQLYGQTGPAFMIRRLAEKVLQPLGIIPPHMGVISILRSDGPLWSETVIWAAKDKRSRHTFHYKLMKEQAGGKQMKSVWQILPPDRDEKHFGKHPTQKPIALLEPQPG